MTRRELRRYLDDMLAGRQPKSFSPDDFEAAQLRTAIDLTAARDDAGEPRPEFVAGLRARLAGEMSSGPAPVAVPPKAAPSATRRQVIVGTTAAATAAVAAVSVDRLVLRPTTGEPPVADPDMVPLDGSWQTVASSAQVSEGGMHAFDLGSVSGFVGRVNGTVQAVSGVCTHQGCKLWFDQTVDRLRCPCHSTSFSPTGMVVTHALPIAPKPLPHFEVREQNGVVEVLAPPTQTT
ncbi:nitrite reductase/ring-hydroxylating ferredoxin subunit [Mycolicibacterium sp. BK634]|uniref:Rieske (2Fe-2S) protein n=1 Tax=Mycolicibacterium sp. BK634 TaxID=2587099 RepID=UPI00160F49AF|nr:Rieske (2Fe-2S) protein [Mycolicibacterium sp. BK634]MBB3747792.1 nitrite reductase/ring-hydroxylating ferredoxin subunit [Mycolicibacterium sp. BK634]